jgi:hypothetical protein
MQFLLSTAERMLSLATKCCILRPRGEVILNAAYLDLEEK